MSGGGSGSGSGEEWGGGRRRRAVDTGGWRGWGLREGQKEGEMHTSDTRRISLFRMKSRYQSGAGYTSPETEAEGGGAEINRRGKTEEKKKNCHNYGVLSYPRLQNNAN